MGNIGPTELIIVLVIVLVIFGPKRLPGLGRQLGGGMREFKDSITGDGKRDDDEDDDEPRAALTRAEADDVTATSPKGATVAPRPDAEPPR